MTNKKMPVKKRNLLTNHSICKKEEIYKIIGIDVTIKIG